MDGRSSAGSTAARSPPKLVASLLREVEQRSRIRGRLSYCFTDHRDPHRVEHPVEALIKQRVLGLCLGYEDLNDHDELCRDRLLALLCDRDDLTGEIRRLESDRGQPLAGKSTLNRSELTPAEGPEGRYKKWSLRLSSSSSGV